LFEDNTTIVEENSTSYLSLNAIIAFGIAAVTVFGLYAMAKKTKDEKLGDVDAPYTLLRA